MPRKREITPRSVQNYFRFGNGIKIYFFAAPIFFLYQRSLSALSAYTSRSLSSFYNSETLKVSRNRIVKILDCLYVVYDTPVLYRFVVFIAWSDEVRVFFSQSSCYSSRYITFDGFSSTLSTKLFVRLFDTLFHHVHLNTTFYSNALELSTTYNLK